MQSAFVSGLWGDAVQLARPGIKPFKVYDDVQKAATWEHKAEPRLVYAYGMENQEILCKAGFNAILLSEVAVPNYTGKDDRAPNVTGSFAYGASVWRAKIEFMLEAMQTVDEIVWLDWDIMPTCPVPVDFWTKMREGQPFQAALRQLHRVQCGWRKTDSRKLHHGGFVYVRGREVVNRLLELCIARPDLNDELIYGLMVDELMGGEWLGYEKYLEMGFQPYCYDCRMGACFKPTEPIFYNFGK